MTDLLVLRPEPGCGVTVAAAAALGLAAVAAPLFRIEPVAWALPDPAGYDALLLTSANAIRHAGPGLDAVRTLPAYAVGAATAAAARAAGFAVADEGREDARAIVAAMAAAGVARALHLAGEDAIAVAADTPAIDRRIVYRAVGVDFLPAAAHAALAEGAAALLHSPRAALRFAMLIDGLSLSRGTLRTAAISAATAAALGTGWAAVVIAELPTDAALLAAAAGLCEEGRRDRRGARM